MDNNIFSRYIPKYYCREYFEIKKSSLQLGMFMAVVLGIKPLMDDWIPTNRIQEFRKLCRKYGLKVRENIIFQNVAKDDITPSVLGRELLTTTSTFGFPVDSGVKGEVHVFISKSQRYLQKAMWYPAIIKKRVIFQPRIDSLRYGYSLGYPDCCIRFFRKYNDWCKYSHLYEAYIRTVCSPSFLCNPFLKDTPFSYIYHMPCSYSCRETMQLAGRLREEIKKREPGYVKLTDSYLKMPFLVFYERKFYCFEGLLYDKEIRYKKVYFPGPDPRKDTYGKRLRKADKLRWEGRRIVLFKKNRVVDILEATNNLFAPEHPFLIKFS